MDVLTTILTCSLYLADDSLVRAIAESTSQSNPYFVFDAAVDMTEVDPPAPPKTVEAAVARVEEVAAKGGRPLVGLMQLPPAWVSAFGRDLREAFDPCTNVAIGSAMLSQFDYECDAERAAKPTARSRGRPAPRSHAAGATRRACILRKYQDAIGLADFVDITTFELRYQRLVHPDVSDAPIVAPAAQSAWGPRALLVHATTAPLLSTPSTPLASIPPP
jgi:Transglycosylase SLT domain